MDLIPGYNNYLDSYQFPETVTNGGGSGDQVIASASSDSHRQRALSGDRVVILPRRPSETETMSPEFNGHPHSNGHGPDRSHPHTNGHGPDRRLQAPEWRVPPQYPPESLYPGEFHNQSYNGGEIALHHNYLWCNTLEMHREFLQL